MSSVHVVASILRVGPIALSASLFIRYAPVGGDPHRGSAAIAGALHRIIRVYGVLAVPVSGLLLVRPGSHLA